jgi:hypothetical protein
MNGQLAKDRIDDMIREADVYRMSKSTRQARKAERRSRIRRVGTAMSSVVSWLVTR